MKILAFDCAGPVLSAGLLSGGDFFQTEAGGRRHSELIMDMAAFLLEIAGLFPGDLDLAACMRGPGSFTGIRIGFAAVKGAAAALGIPFVSVPTLDCAAWSYAAWPGVVLPVIDAKKNAFFAALYRAGAPITPYLDAGAETIAENLERLCVNGERIFLTGPGAELLAPRLEKRFSGRVFVDPACRRGRAWELIQIAKNATLENTGAGPLYIRKSDAELNLDHV